MALPKLNSNLIYETTVPSTGQRVKFRPFLVGEEKLFLIAAQSESIRVLYDTIKRVVDQCVETEGFDVNSLKGYDLDYLFLQLRAKSVGETEDLQVKCGECDTVNGYRIDFENGVTVSTNTASDKVDLGGITISLREPDTDTLIAIQENTGDETEMAFTVIEYIIDKVYTDEEVFDFASESSADRQEFIQSMTSAQLANVFEYVQGMPQVTMDISFACGKCGTENVRTLKGVADFFG